MQKIAVVFFPRSNLEKINSFRKNYDPSFNILLPHITIVSPLSELSENQLIEHAEKAMKGTVPFAIHFKGLYKTSDNYFFLLVKEGNENIVKLRDRLYSGIMAPHIPTDFPFVSHITLGCFIKNDKTLDEALYTKAYSEAEALNFDFTDTFDSVSIINGDGTTSANIIRTIKLCN